MKKKNIIKKITFKVKQSWLTRSTLLSKKYRKKYQFNFYNIHLWYSSFTFNGWIQLFYYYGPNDKMVSFKYMRAAGSQASSFHLFPVFTLS